MLAQLQLLIRSGNPLISVVSHDEDGVTDVVRTAVEGLGVPLFEWTLTSGMVRTLPAREDTPVKPGKAVAALDYILDNNDRREVYFLKDLGPHCKDPYVQRQLHDIHQRRKVSVVLLDLEPLPESTRRLVVTVEMPLPTSNELEKVIRSTFREIRDASYEEITSSVSKRDIEQMAQTLRGLTRAEAARVVAAAIHHDNALTPTDLPRLVEYKRNLLRSAGCLEAIAVNVNVDEIGGLDNLKAWLAKRRGATTAEARAYGLDAPRGILLLGVQGCGKSLCAKVVAADWQVPLLRMDPGVLYQKYIGETENRLREALAQAQAMAPVVLWIDEIEKAFASAASTSADGGLSQRMFGTLLSWMQDHRSPIFIVATANDIEALPPELMRKGRFDEVFFVDLPSVGARRKILEIHLHRRGREPKEFDLGAIAAATDGFSGAELEQLIVAGMYTAFAKGEELADKHLLAERETTKPLARLMRERVVRLREWARDRCVPAD
ncbi:MAG TPA: AAA family ATPase [Gemmataceae bacterium]|nr:AAA family ATPase [Gemmataceae bacterium]